MTWFGIINPVRLFLVLSLCGLAVPGFAADPTYDKIGLDPRIGQKVSLDLQIRLANGQVTPLRKLIIPNQPLVVVLAYYHCPMLCSLVLDGVQKSVASLWPSQKFTLLTVSIDPREPLINAQKFQKKYAQHYSNWHFAIASGDVITALEKQIGFRSQYIPKTDEYAHPAVMTFLTPDGRISRYLFGVEFKPKDVRLALAEARNFQFNSAIDKVMLFCYNYDPTGNRYVVHAFGLMKVVAAITVFGLVVWIAFLTLQERRKSRSTPP